MEHLFIILWKQGDGWQPLSSGIFADQEDAKLVIRAEKLKGSTLEYHIFEARRITETPAEAEARLGPFEAVAVPAPIVAKSGDDIPF
jgi:hypothetical protein